MIDPNSTFHNIMLTLNLSIGLIFLKMKLYYDISPINSENLLTKSGAACKQGINRYVVDSVVFVSFKSRFAAQVIGV